MMSQSVAVIDVGSNSIKALVAARAEDEGITTLHARTIDTRISAGISHVHPHLSVEAVESGIRAIRELIDDAARFSPRRTIIVATSAVRDATNGAEFAARVQRETGHELRILTGAEEAGLIGQGLICDPALRALRDFYVFDLGGGSLECLVFRDRRLEQAVSFPLGCVRLMEKFIPDPTKALGRTPRYRIMQLVHDELVRGAFKFSLAREATAIGTGGTFTTIRAILGARDGKTLEQTEPEIPLTQLRLLLTRLSRMTLEERKQVPGLPAGRADIFPTALATLIVLSDVGAFPGFRHSLYNLRYGLAVEALRSSST